MTKKNELPSEVLDAPTFALIEEKRRGPRPRLSANAFRRHVVYLAEFPETYVGMTVEDEDPVKSARDNIKHYWHVSKKSDRQYPLPKTLRNLETLEAVRVRILDRPIGKEAAKEVRRKYIERINPDLNSPGYIKKAS